MKVLLDTHTFLWAVEAPDLLGKDALRAIADPESDVFVSGFSVGDGDKSAARQMAGSRGC